jgi:hypothetical protein
MQSGESGRLGARPQVRPGGDGYFMASVDERPCQREQRVKVPVRADRRDEHSHRRLSRPSMASNLVCVSSSEETRTGVPNAPLAANSAACGSNIA